MTNPDLIDASTEDLETFDRSIACSNCYTGEAYARPGAACAWCSAPRGVCGGCGAGSSELPLCAECGLHEESVHELARRVHLVQTGEGGPHLSLSAEQAATLDRLVTAGDRPASLTATRSAVIRRVVQWGVDALERELGLAEPETVPPELQARIAAVAARSPDVLERVARRARQLAPVAPRTRVLGTTRFAPPTAEEREALDRTAVERGLLVLEQELGITTP
ncbi:MAG: hypothetical protein AMXMBFR56_47820 [Polyangiaceae bacterium]